MSQNDLKQLSSSELCCGDNNTVSVPVGCCIIFSILLFMSSFFSHLALSTNDGSRYALVYAIVNNHSLSIDGVLERYLPPYAAVDYAVYKGRKYCDKAPVGALIITPIVYLANIICSNHYFLVFISTFLMSSLPFAIYGAVLFLIMKKQSVPEVMAFFLVFALTLGTNLFYWSTVMFSHSMTAMFIIVNCYLLLYHKKPKYYFAAGVVAGLAVGNDYYTSILLILFGCYVLMAQRRYFWFYFVGALVAGLIPAVYHFIIFENPLSLPYKYHGSFKAVHKTGIYGMTFFRLKAIWDLLLSYDYGLFFFNPILLIVFAMCKKSYNKNRLFSFLAIASVIVMVLLVGSINHVSYGLGFSWGPRYLCTIIPIISLLIVLGWRHKMLYPALLLGGLSIVWNYFFVFLYYLPPEFSTMSFIAKSLSQIYFQTGGLSILAQCNKILQWNIGYVYIFIINMLVLSSPFCVVCMYVIRQRRQVKMSEKPISYNKCGNK